MAQTNPSLQLQAGVQVQNPVELETDLGPYATVAEANAAIITAKRFPGKKIKIVVANVPTEYWWSGGIADVNLIAISTGSAGLTSFNTRTVAAAMPTAGDYDAFYFTQAQSTAAYQAKFGSQAPNTFYRGPVSGASALPTFGALVNADLPVLTGYATGAPYQKLLVTDNSFTAIQKLDGTIGSKVDMLSLQNFQINAARISDANYPTAKVTFAALGDSVALDAWFPMYRAMHQGYGFGGVHGGGTQAGTQITLGGGAASIGSPVLVTALTRFGTTATATSTAHGLINGANVNISGASDALYNVAATISNVTANTFDFTVSASAATPDPSSTIYWTASADYSKWITGGWMNLPTGGTISYFRPIFASVPSSTFNTAKVFYIKEVGAGTFKIQTSPDGTTWTDLAGYTSISAVDTQDNFGVVTAPLGTVSGQYQIRVVGVTGSVKIITLGLEADKGAKLSFLFSAGGLKIKDMSLTPQRIWVSALQDLNPDSLFIMFKDDTDAPMIAALSTIQANIDAALGTCRTIWSATTLGPGDDGFLSVPSTQWSTTQNAEIEKFVRAYTGQSVISYWDCTKYTGPWTKAAFVGSYDISLPKTISTASVAGTTVTIVTSVAHGLVNGNPARINKVLDNKYNGVFIVTVLNTTTFTYTKATNTPVASSTSGESCKVDYAHLADAARNILCSSFIRDFSMFSGLGTTDYPWTIGTGSLLASQVARLTANDFTGLQFISNTTDASGFNWASSAGALRVAGGIYAQKIIRSDKQITVASTDNSFGAILASDMTAVAGNTVGASNIVKYYPTTNVSTNAKASYNNLQLGTSGGTAGVNSFTNYAVHGRVDVGFSGTGTILQIAGIAGEIDHSGSQLVTNAIGLSSTVGSGGASRITNAYGVFSYMNLFGTSVTNSFAFYVEPVAGTNVAANKWAFFNNSVANSASLGKYKFGANTAPVALVDIAAGTTTVAPVKLTNGTNLTTPTAGALEFDGTNLYFTPSSTRLNVTNQVIKGTFTATGTATSTFTVTIPTQANNTYVVTPVAQNAVSAASFYVTNQTTTTYDIVTLTALTGAVAFGWTLVP